MAVAVVLVAVGAAVAASREGPALTRPDVSAVREPVTTAVLRCPGAPARDTTSRTLAVALPSRPPPRRGALVVGGLAASVAPARTAMPGVPVFVGARAQLRDGVEVTGSGSAAGAAAVQLSDSSGPRAAGVAAGTCPAPGTDWWFVGVDTSASATSTLVLDNPTSGVAVVDLAFLGDSGPVDAPGATGLAVGPGARLRLDLARFAPGQSSLALHVTARQGTIAAAVALRRVSGTTPIGTDWVPSGAAPSRVAVVGPLPPGVEHRWLYVANPGSRQRLVHLRVLDTTGAFTPAALRSVQVPPESVARRSLEAVLGHRAGTLELRATGPVAGAVRSDLSGPRPDVAFSGSTAVLAGAAVVPRFVRDPVTLSVAATRPGPTSVTVRVVDTAGQVTDSRRIRLDGVGTTVEQPSLPAPTSYLEVSASRSAGVHVVVAYRSKHGVGTVALRAPRRFVVRPAVVPDTG